MMNSFEECRDARFVLDGRQRVLWGVFLAALLLSLALAPYRSLLAINFFFVMLYLSTAWYKLNLVLLGLARGKARDRIKLEDPDQDRWPVYTILLPVFRETSVLLQLIGAVDALDYPVDKLDIKILVEADDHLMRQSLDGMKLPPCYQVLVLPEGHPRTKPRACNHGLDQARGEYLVIYDAEDIPDPDQLRKSVCHFRSRNDPRLVCLQARLNYYNPRQNLLTRWFTAEYSMWFDLYLPGLDWLGVPIPLGGTSNHFKTEALRSLGGWDSFNVTEDCDLGIRLFKAGYHTEIMDSTTWEEANSQAGNWLRQRSRWVKGFIQTWLVHTRNPFSLVRRMGFWNALSFHLTVGGLFVTLLVNPFYWVATGFWFYFYRGVPWLLRFPDSSYLLMVSALLAGNLFFVLLNVLGCLKRGLRDLVLPAVFSPFYWVLMSLAAWRGFYQVFRCPHFWEKTVHGLAAAGDRLPTAGKMNQYRSEYAGGE